MEEGEEGVARAVAVVAAPALLVVAAPALPAVAAPAMLAVAEMLEAANTMSAAAMLRATGANPAP